jgi:S-adenosylmethionine:tRNA ribosyltransferase-isomerase
MHTSELDYHLPAELIAQQPARPRDSSRMLVLHRKTGEIEHRQFRDLPSYLAPDDTVVLNNTRVIRARLLGRREPGGGRAEALLLAERSGGLWEALVTPGRRIPVGRRVVFGEGRLTAEVVARTPSGGRLLRFSGAEDVTEAISRLGELPTPPYLHRPIEQESDYQTVYAEAPGASAAPTAGLHFTPQVLEEVRARAGDLVYVTLHIGLGTFRPIRTEVVEEHEMHAEWYEVPEETAGVVSQALADGRRVVAVGTSTARALEAACDDRGRIRAGAAETNLFILAGYRFRALGALLTNFHMPRSTLLALVCAFAGREHIMRAYREAVAMGYRFLSFGDAMLIL